MHVDPSPADTRAAGAPAERRAWILLAGLILATALVYWPSLSGGWLFDDTYYVMDPAIQVRGGALAEWVRAALSQSSTNQFRALSMLSFAMNFYLTGPDPWWFKASNLGLHLFNGIILFALLKRLFELNEACADTEAQSRRTPTPGPLLASVVTGLWLLAPINLTGVAYISQRIEALATTFIFLGLLVYVRARLRNFREYQDMRWGWVGLIACLLVGVAAKESAVLLPAFTFCIEWAITGFRNRNGSWSRPAVAGHILLLGLPMLAGLFWMAHWDFAAIKYLRSFTIGERLLTEPRILADYLAWTVFPSLPSLTFYHDDIALSHGLLDPPGTAAAIVFLLALFGIGLSLRKRLPLYFLGTLWFFAGHSMTATVIPLELAFEHRNYLPSVGVFLALAALTSLLPEAPSRRALPVAAGIALLFFSTTTLLRAMEWSNPMRLAYSEAIKRPESMRAQYGLAQSLIFAAGRNPSSPLLAEARDRLDRIVYRKDSGVAPAQALIYLDGIQRRPVNPELWLSIINKLRDGPVSMTDTAAIILLFRCMQQGYCPKQVPQMHAVLDSAVKASGDAPNMLALYADFAFLELHDVVGAERMLRAAISRSPRAPAYRISLANLLLASGQTAKARIEVTALAKLNFAGSLNARIAELEATLAVAQARAAKGGGGVARRIEGREVHAPAD